MVEKRIFLTSVVGLFLMCFSGFALADENLSKGEMKNLLSMENNTSSETSEDKKGSNSSKVEEKHSLSESKGLGTIKTSGEDKNSSIPLTEREIDKILLDFEKEREQKELEKQRKKEEAERLKQSEEKNEIAPIEVVVPQKDKPKKKLTIEEKKMMLLKGMNPDAPEGQSEEEDGRTNIDSAIKKVVNTPTVLYGVSCLSGKCVLLGKNKIYKVGDTLLNGEEITKISIAGYKTKNGFVKVSDMYRNPIVGAKGKVNEQ